MAQTMRLFWDRDRGRGLVVRAMVWAGRLSVVHDSFFFRCFRR